ncbi:LysR family transcriptional regulator [Pseudomonas fluorescens]|uniref:LysR family transcriptional regulator n=1 Tax=Pseudomonas fluorescens TaxID=294 RepID=UPI000937FF2C|nr:LysR family transcriptional regulator [Pseudomonas fluorescens]
MDIKHLRYFLAVAEELNFSRAAKRVHVEQSPLSRAIRRLEADLGATLFDRNCRRMELTAAGRVFQQQSQLVLTALQQARREVTQATRPSNQPLSTPQTAKVRHDLSETLSRYLIKEHTPENLHQVNLDHEIYSAAQAEADRLCISIHAWVNCTLKGYLSAKG